MSLEVLIWLFTQNHFVIGENSSKALIEIGFGSPRKAITKSLPCPRLLPRHIETQKKDSFIVLVSKTDSLPHVFL
jgi:hypothetical protein